MTGARLVTDLLALGVNPGGVLLVHSSLRSLGPLEGGAETVVKGLLEALGPQGTLLMPALSYETVGARNPLFDVAKTPSCVGALPEYFRTRPGTMRSVHPTHSVSGTGRLAEDLLGAHVQDTSPCGPNSPFSRLAQVGGQILFLGCGLRPNTSMHGVEEQVEPPYLFGKTVDYQIILPSGDEIGMSVRSHNFRGWEQRYDRLEQVMSEGLVRGRVLQADCWLVESAKMWPAAQAALEEEPLFFVEQKI